MAEFPMILSKVLSDLPNQAQMTAAVLDWLLPSGEHLDAKKGDAADTPVDLNHQT